MINRPLLVVSEPPNAASATVMTYNANDVCKNGKLMQKTTEIYAIDRSTLLKPLRLRADPPIKVHYSE